MSALQLAELGPLSNTQAVSNHCSQCRNETTSKMKYRRATPCFPSYSSNAAADPKGKGKGERSPGLNICL